MLEWLVRFGGVLQKKSGYVGYCHGNSFSLGQRHHLILIGVDCSCRSLGRIAGHSKDFLRMFEGTSL